MPVGPMDIQRSEEDEEQNHPNLNQNNSAVEVGGLTYPDNKQSGDEDDDKSGGEVKDRMNDRSVRQPQSLPRALAQFGGKRPMERLLQEGNEVT